MSLERFRGVWVAMVTPWDEVRGSLPREVVKKLVNRFFQAGVDGLFILGTTGEGPLLNPEERKAFAEVIVEEAEGKLPVIVHVGHNQTRIAIDLALHAKAMNALAVAISSPAWYRFSESELETHFVRIASAIGDFPVLLYDIPSATGNPLSASLLAHVSGQAPNIVGVKVSRLDWHAWEEYLSLADRMTLLIGADGLCLPLLVLGAQGIVSGLANVIPEPYVQLYQAVQVHDIPRARFWQNMINRLRRACNDGLSISTVKKALRLCDLDVGESLAPFSALSGEEEESLYAELTQLFNDLSLKIPFTKERRW